MVIPRELKSGSNSSHSFPGTVVKAFRDYEKKTIDAWDIDENECFNLADQFPISNIDSVEVAKKVIKDHKETQEKLQSSTSISSKTPTKASPGPGKAFRQDTGDSSQISAISKSLNLTSISSSDKNSRNVSNLKPSDSFSAIQKQTNEIKISSVSTGHQVYVFKDLDEDSSRIQKFESILNSSPINLSELEKLSWKGIPKCFRAVCWKLLSDYLPLKKELQKKTIEQKRNSYWESVTECYSPTFLELNHDTLRQILSDIPRMNPLIPIFQNETVQNIFQRILYVWAVRHPASGYVQGINDLLAPFFVVFLTDYIQITSCKMHRKI